MHAYSIYAVACKNSQIHYLLVITSSKHKEIFNYYRHDKLKLNSSLGVFCWLFFNGFYPKKPGGFLWVLPRCLNPVSHKMDVVPMMSLDLMKIKHRRHSMPIE